MAQRVPAARAWLVQAIAPRLGELVEPVLDVTFETGDPLGSVFADLLEGADAALLDKVCERTDTALDQYSTSLLEIGVVAARRLIHLRAREWPQPETEECAELGRLALNLAVRLTNRQALAGAEGWARESVTLLSGVAQNDTSRFLGLLVHSLSTLGSILVQTGKHSEALHALDPVVSLLQRSARNSPELRLLLASSLNSIGLAQQGAGQSNEESFRSFEESVAIYRELAPGKPETWIGLASSLYNLIGSLNKIGSLERALFLAREVTELTREYTSFRADIFLPILALSLDVRAQALREASSWREALTCQVESTAVYRRLAATHPRSFLSSLAMGLTRQGMLMGELGAHTEGTADLREAIEIFKDLRSEVLIVDRMQLADACDQLALLLYFQGGKGALGHPMSPTFPGRSPSSKAEGATAGSSRVLFSAKPTPSPAGSSRLRTYFSAPSNPLRTLQACQRWRRA